MDDLLARAVFDEFRLGVAEVEGRAEELDGFLEAGWRSGLDQRAQFGGDVVHGRGAHADRDAFPGAHHVYGNREGRNLSIDRWLFDQQRLAAPGRFHLAIGQFGDFEFAGNGLCNAGQLTGPFELPHEFPEGFKCHRREILTERPSGAIDIIRLTVRVAWRRNVPFAASSDRIDKYEKQQTNRFSGSVGCSHVSGGISRAGVD